MSGKQIARTIAYGALCAFLGVVLGLVVGAKSSTISVAAYDKQAQECLDKGGNVIGGGGTRECFVNHVPTNHWKAP